MAWLRKKVDPISDRAKALNDEIADLEAQIRKLDSKLQKQDGQTRSRSTPESQPVNGNSAVSNGVSTLDPPQAHEPVFETVDQERLKNRTELGTTPAHYNEFGVRKYDLPALIRRIRTHFRAPSTTNPKLVSYLAAGGIQGLRPLRYEKRVARNRFIALVLILFAILLGIVLVFVKHR